MEIDFHRFCKSRNLFHFSNQKVSISEFASIFSTISQIIGTEYYEFLHKHVEIYNQ